MTDTQAPIIEFLSSPETYGMNAHVDIVETHGAYVFLCGDTALKLKRAVHYDYMDFSTVEKRRAMLDRELQLNQPVAPEIYRDILPVTEERDGRLALGGNGRPVDWVLRMRRFPAKNELRAIAERGALDDRLAWNIGVALSRFHGAAPERRQPGAELISAILNELSRVFAEYSTPESALDTVGYIKAAEDRLADIGALLDKRGQSGHIRRAHGDLHLGNLVLIDGRPVPFDALEFDERLGTCDLLYDLGFLLMDLCHHNLDGAACRVLSAWLTEFQGSEDEGLAALPLFLSVRAAIRAMVLLQTDAALERPGRNTEETAQYMSEAHSYLDPDPPMLIAVGGVSGTGKSVFARGVSPGLGAAPGAVVVSSDAVRKAGRNTTSALKFDEYSEAARRAVYDQMMHSANSMLAAGHSVVLDATFFDPELRRAAEQIAERNNVPFKGFWLEAPKEVLRRRVQERTGDLSDADVAVLERQLMRDPGTIMWNKTDATRSPEEVVADARLELQPFS